MNGSGINRRARAALRTVFAQESLKPDEVLRELDAVRTALGGRGALERFIVTATEAHKGVATQSEYGNVMRTYPTRLQPSKTQSALDT